MSKIEEKIIALEMKIAQLEHNVEELSNVLVEQWDIINAQGNSLKLLANKCLKLEEENFLHVPIDKPPHF